MNKKVTISAIVILLIALFAIVLYSNLFNTQNSSPQNGLTQNTTSTNGNSSQLYLHYYVVLPNSIILTDTQGRRVGKDAISGTIYNEIPGAQYGEEGHSGELLYYQPPAGKYTIQVIGAQNGNYTLESRVFDGEHPPVPQVVTGTIKKGGTVTYNQSYNPTNLASSTLVLQ